MSENTNQTDTQRKIESAMRYHLLTNTDMTRAFPFISEGVRLAGHHFHRPDAATIRQEAEMMISGALIVYLFAMWD